jgi:hypothetical protein
MKEYRTPAVYLVGPASQCIQICPGGSGDGIALHQNWQALASKLEEE